jgi:hypothetical protein
VIVLQISIGGVSLGSALRALMPGGCPAAGCNRWYY